MSRTTTILPQIPPPAILYERMLTIRLFETLMEEEAKAGRLPGTFHSSVGQEAVAVGVCASLTHDDLVVSNHRGHGHFIAKGGDVFRIMAELYGREAGYSGGKGGTQHMAGVEVGFMGSNGITAGGIPVATGLAMALQRRNKPNVAISFFGDGATNQGVFHESLNMAAIYKLPVIYICENNGWGMSTPVESVTAGSSIAHRGEAYGILYKTVDGNDVEAVMDNVRAALTMVMHGEAPTLIECRTWRVRGHSRSDMNLYRDKNTDEQWMQRDPIALLRSRLIKKKPANAVELDAIEAKVKKKLDEALAKCRELPPARPETAFEKVYVPVAAPIPGGAADVSSAAMAKAVAPTEFVQKPYWQAIQEAMCEAMDREDRYFVFGEDVAEYGGCFKVTRGMLEKYGKSRIVNTPVSEAGIAGLCVGAAMGGMKPIGEIMFMDFILLALDQIANHAAKFHYIYNGQIKVPLVIRTPMGGYRGYGATHSQCLDSLLMKFPGLRVVTPWSPRDAKGLLKTALLNEDPVIFVEHKALYGTTGPVPTTEEYIPLGKANIVRAGQHVTLCANSYMVSLCMQAAEILSKEGIEAEIVDLRCLAPLDRETVAKSAARTQALVIVEEGHYTLGIGAEIAASVQELAFGYLDAPILRVAAADTPVPSAIELERAVLPSVDKIVATVKKALEARG
ncbi:MAG TPA: dehydrogenase E1 component subunit alpha/beta [Planctomycetota bacterium]|nr:dehydrogenase E1 component subunit alpha/beta [Planctomycetota bacterium]